MRYYHRPPAYFRGWGYDAPPRWGEHWGRNWDQRRSGWDSDRVILMPGPDDELCIVNQIYRWFIDEGLVEAEIAGRLNGMRVRTDLDRDWTRATVHEVLTNEKYIGNNVYNRISFKLKKHRVINTPDMWIRKEGAFDAIVPPEVFYTAQGIIRARAHRYTNEELIERLRNLYQSRGFLSGLIIDETEGMPSTSVYVHRFGSLIRAYQAVGFTPDRDYRYLETNRFLCQLHPEIVGQTEKMITDLGGIIRRDPATDLLRVNQEFTVSLVLARCQTHDSGRNRWKIRFDTSLAPRWIAGVCGGIARSTGVDSWAWRLLFAFLFFCGGAGLLLYGLLWIFVPTE
ncbi:MAG: recombinase family protein [Thiobacillaceae bacterium]